MCTPFAALAGLSSAQTALGAIQQSAAASAESERSQRVGVLARGDANRNFIALQRRRIEEQQAAAQSIQNVAKDAAKARSSASVGAAEGGVAGRSVADLLDDFSRQEGEFQADVIRKETFRDQQFSVESEAIRTNLQSTLLQNQPRVQQPSIFGTALQLGGGILGAKIGTTDPATGLPLTFNKP